MKINFILHQQNRKEVYLLERCKDGSGNLEWDLRPANVLGGVGGILKEPCRRHAILLVEAAFALAPFSGGSSVTAVDGLCPTLLLTWSLVKQQSAQRPASPVQPQVPGCLSDVQLGLGGERRVSEHRCSYPVTSDHGTRWDSSCSSLGWEGWVFLAINQE